MHECAISSSDKTRPDQPPSFILKANYIHFFLISFNFWFTRTKAALTHKKTCINARIEAAYIQSISIIAVNVHINLFCAVYCLLLFAL